MTAAWPKQLAESTAERLDLLDMVAFKLPMFAKCGAVPFGDFLGIPSSHVFLPGIQVPSIRFWHARSTQVCSMVASCPSLGCSCRKKTCLMHRSKAFGHTVVVSGLQDLLQMQ